MVNCAFYQFLVHYVYLHLKSKITAVVFYIVESGLLPTTHCDKILSKVREITKRDSMFRPKSSFYEWYKHFTDE